jgi:hypothetical protein
LLVALSLGAWSTNALAITDAQVFAFVEANYPTLFAGTPTTGRYDKYNYRYYRDSQSYLAVDTSGEIFVLGAFTGNVITSVGPVTAYAAAITAWETSQRVVTLVASTDKASYSKNDTISLNLRLTNSGTADVCLSKGAIGNIKFTSFTRDGNTLKTRSAPSYFLTSFTEILKSRLMRLAPGNNVEFNLVSSFDPGLNANALSTTMPDETSGITTFYNVNELGRYEIGLAYNYVAGPSGDCVNVLGGPTNTATVTFTIQ